MTFFIFLPLQGQICYQITVAELTTETPSLSPSKLVTKKRYPRIQTRLRLASCLYYLWSLTEHHKPPFAPNCFNHNHSQGLSRDLSLTALTAEEKLTHAPRIVSK